MVELDKSDFLFERNGPLLTGTLNQSSKTLTFSKVKVKLKVKGLNQIQQISSYLDRYEEVFNSIRVVFNITTNLCRNLELFSGN